MLREKMAGDMKFEIQNQTVNAVPALGGAMLYSITLNEIVAIVTVIYIVLQMAYLIWKWHREASVKPK